MPNPWEIDWTNGASQQQPGFIPPDPILARRAAEEEERKRQDQILQQQAEARQAAATNSGLQRTAKLNQLTDVQIAKLRESEDPKADKELLGKAGALDSVVNQINRVQELYDKGIRDERFSNAFGMLDGIGPQAAQFDSAGAALGDQGMAAFKVPGMGPQSDSDAARFVAANQPQASDWDARIEEKLRSLRQRVDSNRKALGLPPAEWAGMGGGTGQGGNTPQGGTGYGSANPTPPPFSPGDPQMNVAQGTRTVEDPVAAKLAGQYRKMLAENRPAGEIIQFLKQGGAQPETLMAAMAQIKYRAQNPNVPIDKYSISSTKQVPLSAYEQAVTAAGSGAGGAYALGAGNFLSGNNLDSLAGDPERARLALQVSQAQNPNAFGIGEMTGGALGALGGEVALGRLGVSAGFGRGLAADAAMGGANGAGAADNGNRLWGAAQGGFAAGMGNAAGTGLMKGAARALTPTGGQLADLYAAGVRPTPGQRFANSGAVGRTLDKTEQKLQSLPVVGDAIYSARQRARDQFQVGAFNEALSEIGETLPKGMKPGTDPHKFAQAKFASVYDRARSGMRVVADQELSNDLSALAPDIQTLGPEAQNKLRRILANTVNNRLQGGTLSGEAYKKAVSDLGKHTARLRRSANGEDQALADILGDMGGAIDGAARRHSDPAAVELMDAADAGYAKLVRIEEAAARRGGDAGTFSPLQFDSATQRTSGGVRSKAYLRGDAKMQDFAAQGLALGDDVPNSGTADRLAMGGAAAGAGYLEPTTLSVLGAIGAAYAPGVRRLTTGAMAPPGPGRSAIARQLERRARLLGRVGGSASAAAWLESYPGQ